MKGDRAAALGQLIAARWRLFFREPGAVFWTFAFPLLLTVALGIAFRTSGPPKVPVAVVDASEADLQLLASAGLLPEEHTEAEAEELLKKGLVPLVIVRRGDDLVYRYDPQRPEARPARLQADDALQRAAGRRDPRGTRDETATSPGARYVDWLIPGLIGLQLMSGSMWGIGWSIVQTRQKKLLKRLVATPMRRGDYLASFLVARLLFVLFEVAVILAFAAIAFDVEIRGSIAAVFGVSFLGAASFAGISLLCASRAQNSETASGLLNAVMLPMFVLSGVFFSARNFPDFLQPLIQALPLTALNDALRALVNEGASLASLAGEVALVAGWGVAAFAIALRIFRWT